MKAKGIELIWIVVNDLDKAIAYYQEVVGLELMERNEDFGWAELRGPNGASLGIASSKVEAEVAAGSNAVISISIENLESALQHFISKGAQLIGETLEIPGHVKMQTVLDPDGNRFQLVQQLSY